MKPRLIWKILAFILAVCSLVVTLCSGIGVYLLARAGLYTQDWETWETQLYENKAHALAQSITESYVARTKSGFSEEELAVLGWGNDWQTIGGWAGVSEDWSYSIASDGTVRETTYRKGTVGAAPHTYTLSVEYPSQTNAANRLKNSTRYFDETGASKVLYYNYTRSEEYTVTVWLQPGSVTVYNGSSPELYKLLYSWANLLLVLLGVGVLLAVLSMVYLLWSAGRGKDGVCPAGLNRLPLDLYALAAGLGVGAALGLAAEILEELLYYGLDWGWGILGAFALLGGAACIVAFLWALAAQWKTGWSALWRRSLLGKLLLLCKKGIRYVWKALCKLYSLLPLVWKYLLIAAAMAVIPLILFVLCAVSVSRFRLIWAMPLMLSLLADLGLVLYGAFAYGSILRGAEKMADGDLNAKLDTRYLRGSYKTCAENLNALAEVSLVAAREQLKSERMKTELITNVSHDIKTPLTSIINYVDLLQKTEDEQERKQYLQVLERQSLRLKKLIEDLMDMSRATTGDMTVQIAQMELTEALKQALGEFSDKLEAQGLTVVLSGAEESATVQADGSLTWRVLSNLLGNVVKYALPGTRVYVDLLRQEGQTRLSIKNISREPLNVSADELAERFVRGDASRNTEGSGLGLNIAQSLMQLQKGKLELFVDGDLFKVTLTFTN